MYDGGSDGADEVVEDLAFFRRLARELVGDAHVAEDLTQELVVRYLTRPPTPGGSLKAWGARVLRNARVDSLRKSASEKDLDRRVFQDALTSDERYADSAEQSLIELERMRGILRAVGELEDIYRVPVYECYLKERDAADVARDLGIPLSTLRTRLTRAKEALRIRLDSEYGSRDAWTALLIPAGFAGKQLKPGTAASGTFALGSWLWGGLALLGAIFAAVWWSQSIPNVTRAVASVEADWQAPAVASTSSSLDFRGVPAPLGGVREAKGIGEILVLGGESEGFPPVQGARVFALDSDGHLVKAQTDGAGLATLGGVVPGAEILVAHWDYYWESFAGSEEANALSLESVPEYQVLIEVESGADIEPSLEYFADSNWGAMNVNAELLAAARTAVGGSAGWKSLRKGASATVRTGATSVRFRATSGQRIVSGSAGSSAGGWSEWVWLRPMVDVPLELVVDTSIFGRIYVEYDGQPARGILLSTEVGNIAVSYETSDTGFATLDVLDRALGFEGPLPTTLEIVPIASSVQHSFQLVRYNRAEHGELLEVTLESAPEYRGDFELVVRDEVGQPVAGATASVRQELVAVADESGTIQVDGKFKVLTAIAVTAPGHGVALVHPAGGQARYDVTLERAAELELQLESTSATVAAVNFELRRPDGLPVFVGPDNPDGDSLCPGPDSGFVRLQPEGGGDVFRSFVRTVEFEALRPGALVVELFDSHLGERLFEWTLDLEPGQSIAKRVPLEAPRYAQGVVELKDGWTREAVRLVHRSVDSSGWAGIPVPLGRSGSFEIEWYGPEAIELTVYRTGLAPVVFRGVVDGATDLLVTLD